MLKNHKLLYILPEMAFTASVGETPKQDYFFVQSFHQINGEFMKDENFLFENLKKLFERVDEDSYTLVLPDFLFTDTIVNVPETDDVKIAEHLRDQLLPRISVSTFSHETRTSVLLQRKQTAKVQLSAFEKELAATLKLAVGGRKVMIDEVVPLSWTLKAAVSLEPSITIAQLGERLYLAEHYIGINQTVNAPLTDLEIMAETVKTLKGADANLQTAYLFTSVLVEEKLKNLLTKTLPVQQLTEPTEEEAKIPSYVKQIIEVSARTLSLTEFVVPRFSIVVDQHPTPGTVRSVPLATPDQVVEAKSEVIESQEVAELVAVPPVVSEEVEAAAPIVAPAAAKEEVTEAGDPINADVPQATPLSVPLDAIPVTSEEKEKVVESVAPAPAEVAEPLPAAETPPELPAKSTVSSLPKVAAAVYLPAQVEEPSLPSKPETAVITNPSVTETKPEVAPALSFMGKAESTSETVASDTTVTTSVDQETINDAPKAEASKIESKTIVKDDRITTSSKTVVKKKGGMGTAFKKFFLFVLIFVITIALGIGVGLVILLLTGKTPFQSSSDATPLPTIQPVATPTPTPTPSPESTTAATTDPEEEVDLAALKVMVVNATGVSGKAGAIKTELEKGEFVEVDTGNAMGTYDTEGDFVLMKERNTTVIKALEEASKLTLTYDEDYQTEDAAGAYDAVIVLNK